VVRFLTPAGLAIWEERGRFFPTKAQAPGSGNEPDHSFFHPRKATSSFESSNARPQVSIDIVKFPIVVDCHPEHEPIPCPPHSHQAARRLQSRLRLATDDPRHFTQAGNDHPLKTCFLLPHSDRPCLLAALRMPTESRSRLQLPLKIDPRSRSSIARSRIWAASLRL
jgi:hypothetical protein